MRISWRLFNDKGVLAHASVCGYSTILSLVPIIAITLSMITVFTGTGELNADGTLIQEESFSNRVYGFFFDHFVPGVAEEAQEDLIQAKQAIMQFIQRTTGLRFVILVMLVLASVSLFNSIEHAFNEIWSVRFRRSFYTRFLAFWLLLTLTPLLLGLSYYYTSQLLSSEIVTRWKEQEWVTFFLPYFVSYFFTLSAFMFANRFLPNINVCLIPAFVGSALSAILWEIAKVAFDLYITYATKNTQGFYTVFGAYSVPIIFIVWLYYSYLCFLLGPVIAVTIQEYDRHLMRLRRKRRIFEHHRPLHSVELFLDVCRHFREEQNGVDQIALEQRTGWEPSLIKHCLRDLENAHLVHQERRQHLYYPSADPDGISIPEVVERILGFPHPNSERAMKEASELEISIHQNLRNENSTAGAFLTLNLSKPKPEETE